jgi:hypothetical protein
MDYLRIALLDHKDGDGGWYGFDLDGTLAVYNRGDGVEGIGAPIEPIVRLAKGLIAEGKEVRIMTARVGGHDANKNEHQRQMIAAWTEEVLGKRLAVTNQKDPGMIVLYDDRAVQVIANTGEIVSA